MAYSRPARLSFSSVPPMCASITLRSSSGHTRRTEDIVVKRLYTFRRKFGLVSRDKFAFDESKKKKNGGGERGGGRRGGCDGVELLLRDDRKQRSNNCFRRNVTLVFKRILYRYVVFWTPTKKKNPLSRFSWNFRKLLDATRCTKRFRRKTFSNCPAERFFYKVSKSLFLTIQTCLNVAKFVSKIVLKTRSFPFTIDNGGKKNIEIDTLKRRIWQMIGHASRYGDVIHGLMIEGMIDGTRSRGTPRTKYFGQILQDAGVTSFGESSF